MLTIEVRYKLVEHSEWSVVELQPSEFFWSDPDIPEKDWTVVSEPKHNHVAELLKLKASDTLGQAILLVTDQPTGDYVERAYHFWRGLGDYVSLVTRRLNSVTEKELIFSGSFPFKENGSQVVRVVLDEPVPKLTMNCFMWGPGLDDHSLNMLAPDEANKTMEPTR